ncbi:unnamed protein product [Soboliphyme baturini]|uniref:ERCC4 domain-containing protein n=1 Tax=Soboliphyme baturini TaxID=241478 RepID=A0A183J3R6_9BILA|nr:unnamed protein product [Soboliphyme baturini]
MDCGYLEYEDDFCLMTFSENFLLIASTGLCVERLFLRHLEIYSDPSVLVLVVGTNQQDQDYFCECVRKRGCAEPKRLTGAAGTGDRHLIYLEGGVQFVTTNILVNDLLSERLPTNLVTAVLFYRAHIVVRSALEAFVLRTIRQKNQQCLVKAFSDDPRTFCESFGQLQRAATMLQVEKVRFMPRFQAEVRYANFVPPLFSFQ